MNMTTDPIRLWWAAGMLLAYLFLCLPLGRVTLRRRAARSTQSQEAFWLVVYASQTGTAEEKAEQTAAMLHLAGIPARLVSMADLRPQDLLHAQRVLFVVSTYGEGNPPDDAASFLVGLAGNDLSLAQVHYGMLALGDSSYVHFCGFGRMLDARLQQLGAQPMFERIEVDRNKAEAIERWKQNLVHIVGTSDLPDWSGPAFDDWTLVERRVLNPGSAGAPVFHLELTPAGGALPAWESGDLAQIVTPDDPEHPREYSIASIPEDGRVQLLVRLHRRPDGTEGMASGWLGSRLAVGGALKMRVRAHRRFRLEENRDRPLILIGNGTGIAGLCSHLKARIRGIEATNWLIFGERNARCDFHYQNEIEAWRTAGVLQRVDLAFSRDGNDIRYVQDCLAAAGNEVHEWIQRGAAIYVCGSLSTMAAGVDDALADLLGREQLDELAASGRYRRDVY